MKQHINEKERILHCRIDKKVSINVDAEVAIGGTSSARG